jgi:hypothetical protein
VIKLKESYTHKYELKKRHLELRQGALDDLAEPIADSGNLTKERVL